MKWGGLCLILFILMCAPVSAFRVAPPQVHGRLAVLSRKTRQRWESKPQLMKTLIVGDGNFSFAASLARKLSHAPKRFVATSLDSGEALLAKYGNQAGRNVDEILRTGCTVMHGVDATLLSASFPAGSAFDTVIFQHPILDIHLHMQEVNNDKSTTTGKASDSEGGDADFISLVSGISTRDCYIIANRLLILDFLLSAEALLAHPEGEIRVTVKNVPPYTQWNVGDLVQDTASQLALKRTESFDNSDYPGYETMQVQKSTPFPSTLSTTFVFGFSGGDLLGAESTSINSVSDRPHADGERLCVLCNKAFTSHSDLLKHLSSRKHQQHVALEVLSCLQSTYPRRVRAQSSDACVHADAVTHTVPISPVLLLLAWCRLCLYAHPRDSSRN